MGEWVRACGGGRVFVDVCVCAFGSARVCVCVCACVCACESLRASALVTQLPDTFSLLLYCMPLCPVLTAFFMLCFSVLPLYFTWIVIYDKVYLCLHSGIRALIHACV